MRPVNEHLRLLTRGLRTKSVYQGPCQALALEFVPAVFETTGALQREFVDLVKPIAQAQAERFPDRESLPQCSARIKANLNAAIHRGNAVVTRQALLDARVANLRGQCRHPYQPRPRANWRQHSTPSRFPRQRG